MEPHHHRQLYPGHPAYTGSDERPFHTRLDASEGREVVYCHACAAEWYRDEFGIICPACDSEATEFVSPENDPRELDDGPDEALHFGLARGPLQTYTGEEATHELHNANFQLRPNGAFFYNQTIWDGSRPQGSNESQDRQAHDPSGDDVMRQFYDLITNITGPRPGHLHPPGVSTGAGGQGDGGTSPRTRMTTTVFSRGPISVTRTEIRGPNHPTGEGADEMRPMPFPALFGTFMSDVGPPPVGADGHPTGHRTGVGASLTDILNMFVNPGGRHGDAVHSQEALDQIITQLMEAHPQSNAAPPASDAALQRLPRKTVDDAMLEAEGGTAECTICIDSLSKGDTVLVLPCKHWFHEACVTMWLKEHNTCPICRAPMEPRGGVSPIHGGGGGGGVGDGGSGSGGGNQGPDDTPHRSNTQGPGPGPSPDEGRGGRASLFSPWNYIGGGGGLGGHQSGHQSATASPTPSSFSSRRRVFTDNFISSSSTPNPEGHRLPRFNRTDTSTSERSRPLAHATMERSASFRSSRRDSRSPTSPDPTRPTRVRSPHHSASSSRDRAEGGSSHNPLTWLRHAMDRQSSGGSAAPPRDGDANRRHY